MLGDNERGGLSGNAVAQLVRRATHGSWLIYTRSGIVRTLSGRTGQSPRGDMTGVNGKVSEIQAFIAGVYHQVAVTGADGASHSILPISLTADRGQFLSDLCRREGARSVLEIGMAWGLSTLFLLKALIANDAPVGAHVVIDPFQSSDFHRAGLVSIKTVGLESMVEFHEEFSEFELPRMVEKGRLFDFIFIDGNHQFDSVFLDLVYGNRLLKPGGAIVFDDSWADSVFLACRYLESNYGYTPLAEYPPMRPGRRSRRLYRALMRAYRKPSQPVVHPRFYFVPFHEGLHLGQGTERRLRADGMRALKAGDRMAARQAFKAAVRLHPRRISTYLRLLRTYLPWAGRATSSMG